MSTYCNNCGASVQGAAFCAACGTSVTSGASGAAPQYSQPGGNYQNAMWAHLGGLLATVFCGILGWLPGLLIMNDAKVKGDAYTVDQAREAVNFHLQWLIINFALIIVSIITCGVGSFLYYGVGIFMLVVGIMASVATSKGAPYRYPLMFLRLVK